MRANVLPDVRLAKRAGRFVWLSIDTEQAKNADFLARFPIDVWPTFLVIEPRDERPVLKWQGSASAARIGKLLQDAVDGRAGARRRGAEAILARADQANAQGRLDEALAAYREALAQGGVSWPARSRAVESLVLAEAVAGRHEACASTARREAPRLARGPSFANVTAVGLSCASSAPSDVPWRRAAMAALEPLAREAVGLSGLLADHRAGLYEALHEARAAAGDEVGARRIAERWWSFLERERKRGTSADARAALDGSRVGAALALGDPGRALPALEASERDLPDDYNPPARRARLLLEVGRLPEARAAVERALARAYGPRKLEIFRLAATILEQQGDRAGLAALLDRALAFAEGLPAPHRDGEVVSALRAKLAALGRE